MPKSSSAGFASRLLLIASMLLVGLPILAIARLFGGIDNAQLLIAFALTMSTAVFVASLSMAISIGTPKARDAVLRCYAILLALWIVPPVAGWLLGSWALLQPLSVVTDALEYLSPFQVLGGVLFTSNLAWSSIGGVLAVQSIAAVVCTALAVGLVRRIHLRAAGAAARPIVNRLFSAAIPRRRWAVSDRAMLWKELVSPQSKVRLGFFGHLSLVLLAVIALGSCILAIGSSMQFRAYPTAGRFYQMQTMPFSDLIACFGGLAISARAAASISGERERQCWDSLISSPLEAGEIVWAKIWGSLYSARWLVALLGAMWGLGILVDISLFLPALFAVGTLLVVLLFGCSLGVYFSAGANSSLRAMGSTLGTLIFLGGGYLFCCVPMMIGGSGRAGEVVLALCIPFLVAFPLIANDIRASGPEGALYVAYILGLIAYSIASILLAVAAMVRIRPNEDLARTQPQARHSLLSCPTWLKSRALRLEPVPRTASEKGTVPFCPEDSAKLGQSPAVLGQALEGILAERRRRQSLTRASANLGLGQLVSQAAQVVGQVRFESGQVCTDHAIDGGPGSGKFQSVRRP